VLNPILDNPAPNFAELEMVLKGEKRASKVHLVEFWIDLEVLQAIVHHFLDTPWIPWTPQTRNPHLEQFVTLYCRLGYDYVPARPVWEHFTLNRVGAEDTADISRGERRWVNEYHGYISNWDDLEIFPWDKIHADITPLEIISNCLPEGMKMIVSGPPFFERVLEDLLGYEGLFYLLYDEPELVEMVFQKWGQKVDDFYASIINMDQVGGIFHPDDLGFKTSTILSPAMLKQLVFPRIKKFVETAHREGKMFWYHCCGNIYADDVIGDLISDVGIDALHSFQDNILPVGDFKLRYGDRLTALGGIDMNNLVRMSETSLRKKISEVLNQCMAGGRFALGSGNTIANYVPLNNYCILLDESRKWSNS
jgi:uroporphyrinogen decarboxylase